MLNFFIISSVHLKRAVRAVLCFFTCTDDNEEDDDDDDDDDESGNDNDDDDVLFLDDENWGNCGNSTTGDDNDDFSTPELSLGDATTIVPALPPSSCSSCGG